MLFRVIVKPSARKNLRKIPTEYWKRIYHMITEIAKNPFATKKLHGEYHEHYGVRVWPYRIIYKIYRSESLVDIIYIGHRQSVY